MSYDIAVWEGSISSLVENAAEIFQRLKAAAPAPPAARILAYVEALLKTYPEPSEEDEDFNKDAWVWATSPLIGEVNGPLPYLPISYSSAGEVPQYYVELARAHGLTCYNPQSSELLAVGSAGFAAPRKLKRPALKKRIGR